MVHAEIEVVIEEVEDLPEDERDDEEQEPQGSNREEDREGRELRHEGHRCPLWMSRHNVAHWPEGRRDPCQATRRAGRRA